MAPAIPQSILTQLNWGLTPICDPDMENWMTWYVLQHKPAQGDRAVLHLQNQGVACFYPKIEVEKIKGG